MAGSAYEYWQRVDDLLGEKPLSQMCRDLGVKYHTVLVMRSDVRFPKRDLEAKIAEYLGVPEAVLMYGEPPQDNHTPTRTDAIIDKLRTASDMELEMVERILGIGK